MEPSRPVEQLIAALEADARVTLERPVYDYVAGGAGAEVTLAEAARAWRAYRLRPHVLRDVSSVDTSVELLGTPVASPVGIAPVGYGRLLHPDGEAALAGGARGHLLVLSARSDRSVEDIGAAVARAGGTWWFQSYRTTDRDVGEDLVRRAVAAGAAAIVLTGDTPYVATKARAGRLRPIDPGADQAPATLDDIGRLAALADRPVLVKGVLRADDARDAVGAGASGLVASTHGGRQLDRAVASADALAEVVDAAGDVPVLVDGGIRSGHDVLVALALGARAVLVGRPVAWALAAGGADAVGELLDAWTREVAHVLGLAGCSSCRDVTCDLIRR